MQPVEVPTDHATPKGRDLVFALREEAHRLGLPDLEEASDDDLKQLVHVLPDEDHETAKEQAQGAEYTKDQLLVAFMRYVIQAERPEPS